MKTLRRTITPELRVDYSGEPLVEITASNEATDSYNESIMAEGWDLSRTETNLPVPDSHDYSSIANLIGRVEKASVIGRNLVATVRIAVDVPSQPKAAMAFDLIKGGYLKAVSVGFMPGESVSPWDSDKSGYREACEKIGADPSDGPSRIYTRGHQLQEISFCILGANPDALVEARSAGILTDSQWGLIRRERPDLARQVERASGNGRNRVSFSRTAGNERAALLDTFKNLPSATPSTPAIFTPASTMNKKTFSAALEDLEKSRRGQSSSQLLRAFGSYIRAVHQDRNWPAQDVFPEALADEETRLPEYAEYHACFQALAARDVSDLVRFSGKVCAAGGQALATMRLPVRCDPKHWSTEAIEGYAVLALVGLDMTPVPPRRVSNDERVRFVFGDFGYDAWTRTKSQFFRELFALAGTSTLERHRELLNSPSDPDERWVLFADEMRVRLRDPGVSD